jgi:hypothetical protein
MNIEFLNSSVVTYALTTAVLNGTLTLSPAGGVYETGTVVTVTAVPDFGYSFIGWSGDLTGSTNPATILMNGNKSISANTELNPHINTISFNVPGSGTWTVPSNVQSITIQVWSGGGAGGSAYSGTATANTQARGGGGAGGSFAGVTVEVNPGQVIDYTVGAGGVGAASGFAHQTYGNAGGSSLVSRNSSNLVFALGGPGGQNVSVTDAVYGGAGGIAPPTGNTGQIVFYGGNGATANSGGTGGGGGSAGSLSDGGDAPSPVSGFAPGGTAGDGGGAEGGAGHNSTLDGNAGGVPGAGGSGAAVRNNTPFNSQNTHKTGGEGGDGKVVITYYTQITPPMITFNRVTLGEGFELSTGNLNPGDVYELQGTTSLTSQWNTVSLASNVTEAVWTIIPLTEEASKFFRIIRH